MLPPRMFYLGLLVGLWTVWFVLATWFRHANFFSSHFDLGIMDQTLWQTIHGHIFQMTSPTLGFLQSRLAIHGDVLLLAYTPFYALWSDPRMLSIVQILAVASASLPLYWLARRQLSSRWSSMIVVLYLAQPAVHWSMLFDVHAVVLATPLLLWGVWAAVTRRRLIMWIVFIAALLAKEEVGLVITGTAFVLGWRRFIPRRTAWLLGVIGFSWVIIMTGIIIPAFAGNNSHFAINYFSEYGRTVPQILLGIFQHPVIFWHDLVNWVSLGYVAIILGAVALVPLKKPLWLLASLPILVMNLVSNDEQMQSLYYQYTATVTPFVLLATVDGLASLRAHWKPPWLCLWIGGWVGVMVWLWAPFPGMRHHRDAVRVFQTNPYVEEIRDLARALPTDLALVVSNDLGPHFSRRERIWVFPFEIERAEAAVILLNRTRDVRPQAELRQAVTALRNDPQWQLQQSWNNELFYFRKK